MILLDTHIWVWWVDGGGNLTAKQLQHLQTNQSQRLGVSIISCWEVAKLVEIGRLKLGDPLSVWMAQALAYAGIRLIDLTPAIAIESTQLPQPFHRDPADQIIVATSRLLKVPLLTADNKLLQYAHVVTLT